MCRPTEILGWEAQNHGFQLYKLAHRALARILKLPIFFERAPIQNGLKWSKMG